MNNLKEIKLLRKRLNLTQKELAQRSGVSQSLIAKIESEKIDPSFNNAKKIFETLNQIQTKSDFSAKDIMSSKIINVSSKDSIRSAIRKMKNNDISQIPVIDGNHAVGYVSERILLESMIKFGTPDKLIADVMQDSPPIIPLDTKKDVIASLLIQFPLVLVKEKEKLKGIITKSDMLRVMYK
ncbi:MAG: CBS domain-containing protein [Nanoarchaeota archaeon]|nr:CBS domain-containing protein [Nanoarchaeota archaeon]